MTLYFSSFYILSIILIICMYTSSEPIRALLSIPHDEACFTQGLVLDGDILYESCGLYGKSSLRIVDPKTGSVIKKKRLHSRYFAEGIVLHDRKIYMLTWKNKALLVFDANSLDLLETKSFSTYNGQGWGFTTDGKHFIASDGSDTLTFFEPLQANQHSLTVVKHVKVTHPNTGKGIVNINELQYVDGFIYANVWFRDEVLRIDPSSGRVLETYDLSHLYPRRQRSPTADVLNGIAYNPAEGSFLVTGKLWPQYYTVRLPGGGSGSRGLQQQEGEYEEEDSVVDVFTLLGEGVSEVVV